MTGEMLSQEEINALLGGLNIDDNPAVPMYEDLTPQEIDALGEIGNISMGTAATTLFALLNNHKVMITTPRVETLTFEQLQQQVTEDTIAVTVGYTEGLSGMNLMMLKEKDVKVIANLMMGGEGFISDEPISDLHLSAIAEAMNQMIGSASTSMSQMFDKRIDISPPEAMMLGKSREKLDLILDRTEPVVKIAFKIEIFENIIDSELMQVLPLSFAKKLVGHLLYPDASEMPYDEENSTQMPADYGMPSEYAQPQMTMAQPQMTMAQPQMAMAQPQMAMAQPQMAMAQPQMAMASPQMAMASPQPSHSIVKDVAIQKPTFPDFAQPEVQYAKENMDLLLDVALEVSVELGRTHKKIKEILEYGPGSVVELDRLVGEPVDVLVNGKFIAKGEVVVIDENFGIRITDIINRENRI